MKLHFYILLTLSPYLFTSCASEQTDNDLKKSLEEMVESSKTDIGISIITSKSNDTLSINGHKQYPMLSTVKFPIALAVLNQVETGKLSLQQEIYISKDEFLDKTWSPFREKYPNGNISISLEDAVKWMIIHSDNNITDVLIRLVGGEKHIENYIEKFIDSKRITIRNNEKAMHQDWNSQFVNHASPIAYSQLLKAFSEGKILNNQNTKWLYKAMLNSTTGTKRLKGKLPNIKIAQRAGTSFTNEEGITGAINNVGIMELPNKHKIYISVFIRNNNQGFEKGEEMIAEIAKTVYDFYSKH